MSIWGIVAAIYVVGFVWGLVAGDAPPLQRVALAALWPVGPLAFALVIIILLAASLVAFPRVSVPVLAAVLLLWWWMA